jgi:hypothetical protein
MQSTLNPRQSDDPHDVLAVVPDVLTVVPDAVAVAPTDEELSRLARSFHHPSDQPIRTGSDLPAGPSVPPVDATFRPAAVGDALLPEGPRSIGRRATRGLTAALLLAACTGAAAIAWQSYGDAAEQMIAQWVPQRVLTSLLPPDKQALPVPSTPVAAEAAAADAAPPQPAPTAQAAAQAVAPAAAVASVDPAPSPQSMARDIANARQEIDQLKASIEELKAGQQQMSRDMAKASEQSLRPKISAPPPRAAAARVRKPVPPLPSPQTAAAPMLPPAAAPYVPRQPDPQPQATVPPDPELASVPRPPMPVR